MKRCVVRFNGADGFANFTAEKLKPHPADDRLVIALDADGELVGVFDLSCVLSIYLSEEKKRE